eukprot:scaffold5772_cov188-Amphora_coffeaeformis.AAC.6
MDQQDMDHGSAIIMKPKDDGKDNRNEKFVICHGLRYALPYETTTNPTYLKAHLVGQPVDQALGRMFRRHRGTQPLEESTAYWHEEMAAGRVQVRHGKTSRDDPWQWQSSQLQMQVTKGMAVRMRQHVHEKVIRKPSINILFQNEQCVVMDKPGGLATVDETGGMGTNGLLHLVQEALDNLPNNNCSNHKKLTPAHRLDKPVSGVLILGKSPSKAAGLLRTIQRGVGVRKIYIARVARAPESVELVQATTAAAIAGITTGNSDDLSTTDDTFPTKALTVALDLTWDAKHRRCVVVNPANTNGTTTNSSPEQKRSHRQVHREGAEKRRLRKRAKQQHHPSPPSNNDAVTSFVVPENDKGTSTATNNMANQPTPQEEKEKPLTHTTRFRKLATCTDGTILVECQPITGYRHQIRAHLAALGWPVANDVVYGGGQTSIDAPSSPTTHPGGRTYHPDRLWLAPPCSRIHIYTKVNQLVQVQHRLNPFVRQQLLDC